MSEKVSLSFLGTGNYGETTYKFMEKTCETRFFPHALKSMFPDYQCKVLLTKEAKTSHGEELSSCCDYEPVEVPIGSDESELWQLFVCIADAVPEKAELIVDITHGLRSLPVLMLAACQYLQTTKGVSVRHILYGAYELRDRETNISPVFDLQPFLELMAWSSSTEQLWRYGNAGPLAEQLETLHNRSHREGWEHRAKGLKALGAKFEQLNRALSLVRPQEAVEVAAQVPEKLERAKADAEKLPHAKPLELLFEQMAQKVMEFSVPNGDIFSAEGFKAQAKMIEHYLETQQYQQAVTLAREALISKVNKKYDDFDPLRYRTVGEDLLNAWSKAGEALSLEPEEKKLAKPSLEPEEKKLAKLSLGPEEKKLAKLWNDLGNLRNDINHAGMRDNPIPADTAEKNIKEYCQDVIAILQT